MLLKLYKKIRNLTRVLPCRYGSQKLKKSCQNVLDKTQTILACYLGIKSASGVDV